MQIPQTNFSPRLSLIDTNLVDKNLASSQPLTASSKDASYEDAMKAFASTEDQYDNAFRELAK